MKRIKFPPNEFCALLRLSYQAHMDWFRDLFKTRKTVDVDDLEDLSTACQTFILQRMEIQDIKDCVNAFSRAGINNYDTCRAEAYLSVNNK